MALHQESYRWIDHSTKDFGGAVTPPTSVGGAPTPAPPLLELLLQRPATPPHRWSSKSTSTVAGLATPATINPPHWWSKDSSGTIPEAGTPTISGDTARQNIIPACIVIAVRGQVCGANMDAGGSAADAEIDGSSPAVSQQALQLQMAFQRLEVRGGRWEGAYSGMQGMTVADFVQYG